MFELRVKEFPTDMQLPRVISAGQFMAVIATGVVANLLFVWPDHVVSAAGENAVGSVLVVSALIVVSGVLHYEWVSRLDLSKAATLWALRGVMGMGLILVAATDVGLASLLGHLLNTLFYPYTPLVGLAIPFIAIVVWLGVSSSELVARVTHFWFFVGGIVLLAISLIGTIHVTHGHPLWPHVVYAMPMLHGIGIMAYMFLPVGPAVSLIAPRVNASVKRTRYAVLAGCLIAAAGLIIIYVLVIGILGPDTIMHLRWPLVYSLETITLDSTFFISRIGLAVIFFWTAVVSLGFAIHIHLSGWAMTQGGWPAVVASVGIALVLGASTVLFSTASAATRWILQDVDPMAIVYLVLEHGVVLGWTMTGILVARRNGRLAETQPHAVRD